MNDLEVNKFTSDLDTLIIETVKRKGEGPFSSLSVKLIFKDTSAAFPFSLKYPDGLTNIQRAQYPIYQVDNSVTHFDIIRGYINDELIFIVDQNSNKNLKDDSVRIAYQGWHMPIKYDIPYSSNRMYAHDSSWIKIGIMNQLWLFGRSEYLTATIRIDTSSYEIGVTDPRNPTFAYDYYPITAILTASGKRKDSLNLEDIINLNEFLVLNDMYYRFSDVGKDGKYITLVKEQEFNSMIGTQVGMKAPAFSAVTIHGDTITNDTFKDRPTIFANSCGCGGDERSARAVEEISKNVSTVANILHLDSKIKTDSVDYTIDIEMEYNRDFYDKYRKEYCSTVVLVVDTGNRIMGKFEVTDWRTYLPRLLNN